MPYVAPSTVVAGQTYGASAHNVIVNDVIDLNNRLQVVTSSTRPGSPTEGMFIYETDTNKILVYDGAAWDEIHDLDNNGSVSDASLNYSPQSVVTSLPGSPVDGQVIYYQADAANGVIWQLRYRSASSSSYKWEYVGGAPLSSRVLTEQSLGGTVDTWLDLATVGPSITNPLAGDYLIRWGARHAMSTSDTVIGSGVNFGGSAPASNNPGVQWASGVTWRSGWYAASSGEDVRTGLSASTVIKVQYRQAFGNNTASNRYLTVTPIRVG